MRIAARGSAREFSIDLDVHLKRKHPIDASGAKWLPGATWDPRLGPWISASPALPFLAAIIYGLAESKGSTWSIFVVGATAAAAALLLGTILGFLFGLPRTVVKQDSEALLATNTNLDQISDWLTKILVGLGLVEIGRLAHGLNGLASSLGQALGNGSGAHTFSIGMLVYSLADGFLVGYLWTRIVLSPILKAAAEDLEKAEYRKAAKFADLVLSQPLPTPPPPPPPSPLESVEQVNASDAALGRPMPPPPAGGGERQGERPSSPPIDERGAGDSGDPPQ